MTWFEKIIPSRIKTERRTRSVPEGLWMKCPACDSVLYRPEVERNLQVCPKCAHHMRIGARERLTQFLDPESATEIGVEVAPEDPLRFRDSKRYRDRLAAAQKAVGERDAFVVMSGTLEGLDIVAGAFEIARELKDSKGALVGFEVKEIHYYESDAAFLRRVLGNRKGRSSSILVFNDEAHHAYRVPAGLKISRKEAEERGADLEEATRWIEGLDRLHRTRRIIRCFDLSATPFAPTGGSNTD